MLYLRVSSAGQVNTDYDPEGISIPAQRRRCVDKARELGVDIVDEYMEPGKSATAISKRPVYQQMLRRIASERDIDYILVYSSWRMNPNWMENGAVMLELRRLGVTLVSATENIDESPLGEAMSGMLAVFNGFQSAANGQDIKYRMSQKSRAGGTVTLAPLGYLNVPEIFEGRTVRSVIVDEERAPFVCMAFELYASGRYGMPELRDKLTDAGLRTRPTVRYPSGTPISMHSLGKLLRDRYYCGLIAHDGVEYEGRHPALISEELFGRVQNVLFGERRAGTRHRVHQHYLKGLLWCGRCGRRLIVAPGRSKTGTQYFYFRCRGRQDRTCNLPPVPVAKVESSVIEHYATVPIPAELRQEIRKRVESATASASAISGQLRGEVQRRLAELDKKEDSYLDLVGDPDWPQNKLRERLKGIRQQQAQLRRQLDSTETDFENGRALMLGTIDLLSQPQELYRQATDGGRKLLNKAIFDRLYVDHDGEQDVIVGDQLNEPFSTLGTYHREQRAGHVYQRADTKKNGAQVSLSAVPADGSLVVLLDRALRDQSSNKATMVELAGIESCSPYAQTCLLSVKRGLSTPAELHSESLRC